MKKKKKIANAKDTVVSQQKYQQLGGGEKESFLFSSLSPTPTEDQASAYNSVGVNVHQSNNLDQKSEDGPVVYPANTLDSRLR